MKKKSRFDSGSFEESDDDEDENSDNNSDDNETGSDSETMDTGLTIEGDEELALRLLKS